MNTRLMRISGSNITMSASYPLAIFPFLSAMPIISAGVSVINYFDVLKSSLLPLLAICVITTVVTFAATAYSIKLTLHLMRKKENKDV